MREMLEVPETITPKNDDGYFEELTKAIFRAGFSWPVIRQKWDNFRLAFDGFNVNKVVDYGGEEITRLFNDTSIVRNRRKIVNTVDNARTFLELVQGYGSFGEYLRSLDHLVYHDRVKELTALFRGLGRTSAFVFLHCVNEPTPTWQER